MPTKTTRKRLLNSISTACVLAVSSAAIAQGASSQKYDIPSGNLSSGLITFSQQSGYVVVAPAEYTLGKRSGSVQGNYTSDDALKMLLRDSGLKYHFKNESTLVIEPQPLQISHNATPVEGSYIKPVSYRQVSSSPASSSADADDDFGFTLDEIVVTASRRSESVQSIAYNITAVTGESLKKYNITDLTKLSTLVPGMASQDFGFGGSQVVIRGLSVSDTVDGSTVARYLNDTPLDIDLRLLDIERVEVLRGPQGTLYGSGSLGGTIRYILNKPDPTETTVDLHARTFATKESSGLSYDADAVINVPIISDKLALRTVVGYSNEKGYIDYNNIRVHPGRTLETREEKDLNWVRTTNARASMLFNASDDIELVANYFFQQSEAGGRNTANEPFTGDRYTLPYLVEEPNNSKTQLATLDLNWDMGFAELVSSTAYSTFNFSGSQDVSDFLISLGLGYEAYPFFAGFTDDGSDSETFTQEVRLVSQHDGPFQWIAGFYYTSEDRIGFSKEFTPGLADFFGFFRPDDLEYFEQRTTDIEEKAFFGELSYQITDDLRVTGGVRHFSLDTQVENCFFFPLYPGTPGLDIDFDCGGGGTINGVTYSNPEPVKDTFFKVNLDYNVTDDAMVYGTFSQGFRRGGVNAVPQGGQVTFLNPEDLVYAPDTVDSYELGLKSQWFDKCLTFNAALYVLDWTDLQLGGTTGPDAGDINITINGGKAKSKGIELELTALVTENFQVNTTYSHTDSKVKADDGLFRIGGAPDDNVPNVPKNKFTLGLDYSMPTSGGNEILFHTDLSYSSAMNSSFPGNDTNVRLDSQLFVNASITYVRDDWSVSLFSDNLFNEYAPFVGRGGDLYTVLVPRGQFNYVNRPMSVGIEFRHNF